MCREVSSRPRAIPSPSGRLFGEHRLDLKKTDPIQEIFLHARDNQIIFCSLNKDGLADLLENHFLEARSVLDLLPTKDPQRSRFLASGLYAVLTVPVFLNLRHFKSVPTSRKSHRW